MVRPPAHVVELPIQNSVVTTQTPNQFCAPTSCCLNLVVPMIISASSKLLVFFLQICDIFRLLPLIDLNLVNVVKELCSSNINVCSHFNTDKLLLLSLTAGHLM